MTTTVQHPSLQEAALAQVPRILGFGDRDPSSPTFGCFDRSYWHYRLLDMPNARFQEAALLLVRLWKHDFPGNVYFGKEPVYRWAEAALHFWARIRNGDGSVNEVYPYERSFCATAFTTYAMTETSLVAGGLDVPDIRKTGSWLLRHRNPEVANQMAAAALALYNLFLITGDAAFREGAHEKISLLVDRQSPEGFFPEYDGYDIGYLSLTVALLARFQHKSGVDSLKTPLENALRFMERHIAEDGSFSLEGTSRRTQMLYPHGLVRLRSPLFEPFQRAWASGLIVSPAGMDDRYVIPLATDYLEASLETT